MLSFSHCFPNHVPFTKFANQGCSNTASIEQAYIWYTASLVLNYKGIQCKSERTECQKWERNESWRVGVSSTLRCLNVGLYMFSQCLSHYGLMSSDKYNQWSLKDASCNLLFQRSTFRCAGLIPVSISDIGKINRMWPKVA